MYHFSQKTNFRGGISALHPDFRPSLGQAVRRGGLEIPDSVVEIGEYAFTDCHNLNTVVLSKNITSIAPYTFAYCENLQNITLHEGITEIGERAFNWCSSLQGITFPESLLSLDTNAFRGCSFTNIDVPANLTSIAYDAFDGCDALAQFNVSASNTVYTSVDGVLFTKDMDALVCYPYGKEMERYSVPEGVVTIAESAFNDCKNLLSIVFPSSVTSIENNAISGNYYYVYIPAKVSATEPLSP